jgi:prevent-host-death family protein
MTTKYSISEARSSLPRLIRRAERGNHAELTRRGKPVAVLVSAKDYERFVGERGDLWEALQKFRETCDLADLDVDAIYADVRDRSPGRETVL